jgi:ubiquinone biosynthesis protein COQ9
MAKKPNVRLAGKLIDAAMTLAASHGWHALSMDMIAIEVGVTLEEALAVFATTRALQDTLFDRIDEAALAEIDQFTDEDTVRDRLFALLMARLDALSLYKSAVASLLRGVACNPSLALARLPRVMKSMARMLDGAGVPPSGPIGVIRTKGLALIYVTTLRTWIRDDTEDLTPTMVVLDKGLSRAEMVALQFCRKLPTA